MAYDFASDLETVFRTDEFAETALYAGGGLPPVSIPVIFEGLYAASEFTQAEASIENASPKAYCRASDVVGAAHGDTLTIGAKTWHVVEVRPDGTGVVALVLSEDPL